MVEPINELEGSRPSALVVFQLEYLHIYSVKKQRTSLEVPREWKCRESGSAARDKASDKGRCCL
jgi:hypothetical protein